MKKEALQTELDISDGPWKEDHAAALELQGECRIISIDPIKWSWVKFCLFIVPIVATLVPLLLLKYFRWFRVFCFYRHVTFEQATSLYIQATNDVEDIESFVHPQLNAQFKIFYFKNLKYELRKDKAIPVCFNISQHHGLYFSENNLNKGLDETTVMKHRQIYGKNQHLVQTPWYHQYLFQVMTKPFFLLQYFICVIWILENIWIFAVIMLAFSFVTTTVNYILLWRSFKKIKEIAQKVIRVRVIRGGEQQQIGSDMLVPGDLFVPQKELPCDAVLIQGEAYVNESSLTGQSVPIGKFPVNTVESLKESNRWLCEGGIVLETRGNALARVVNVGYATRRGRIIRKILTRVPKPPDFFRTALFFLLETLIVGFILYLATLPLLLRLNIVPQYIVYRLLDYLAWTFPPPLPIFFNLCYSFALGRLRSKGINGTQPEKTVQSAKIKTFCFDKTGTLTQNQVQVHEILRFVNQNQYLNITETKEDPENEIIWKFFATCHTVKEINGEFLGDEVDLRMFLFTDYKMRVTQDANIKFIVQNTKGDRLQVLRINQFESKFQSMSVLVKDCKSGKLYALLKGAPEKIDKNSTLKLKEYENLVAKLSLGGYRTIGFGFKQVRSEQLSKYLTGPRQMYEEHIRALGLVAFENKLKHDTRETILSLIHANIEPKMITGDNIFIAVETGVRAGIIEKDSPVVLIEGRKQSFEPGQPRVFKGIIITRDNAGEAVQTPIQLPEQSDVYLNQQYPIAIDNDFLKLEPEPFLPNQIKLFSRISPENKALIVKRLKEQTELQYKSRPFRQRFFGELSPKIGMCGDGANDLMAIREADVGLGISDSDASYGASFSIVNMMDVDQIIRDSKAAESNLIEMFQYFCTMSWIKLVAYTLLLSDGTSFNGLQTIYFNFISTVWLPIAMALSRPSKKMNKYSPCSNLMGPANHLKFWGNVIIPVAGICAAYFYYTQTSDWVTNTNKVVSSGGYFPVNKSNSMVFILVEVPIVWNSFFIYTSYPFKQRIWKNWIFTLLLVANILAGFALFFLTKFMFQELFVLPINIGVALIALSIMMNFIFLQWLFSIFVQKLELHKYQKLNQDRQPEDINNRVHNGSIE